jgi:GT2 family glycosyltransferase
LIAFIDDDVRVDASWSEKVVAAFTRDPSIAFITGRIGLRAEQAKAERPVALKDDPIAAPLDATTTGPLGHSANMAIRRDALVAVGGFDEALGPGGMLGVSEDYDLFDRLFAAGLKGAYVPAASAVHEQWRTRRQLLGLEWRYGVGSGARISKLRRSDRARAWAVAREHLVDLGLRQAAASMRTRYEFAMILALLHAAGVIVGFVRGSFHPLADGHFETRRRLWSPAKPPRPR